MGRHIRAHASLGAAIVFGLASCTGGTLSDPRSDRLTSATIYSADNVVVPAPPSPPNVLTSALPPDVTIPPEVTDPGTQGPYFDDFSWRSFVALNWRAVPETRNTPQPGPGLDDPAAAVVWESWKADFELFSTTLYESRTRPSPWPSWEEPVVCPGGASAPGMRTLMSLTKFGPVLEDLDAAIAGPPAVVVAQNRSYVRYESRLNKPAYESIRGADDDVMTHLYLRKTLEARKKNGPKIVFKPKSIMVKAAWKELRPDERDRYHHQTFNVLRLKRDRCDAKVMGLVGFHIIRKTATRPGWVWSTFEHVDNVPEPGKPPEPGRSYSFYDPGFSGAANIQPIVSGDLTDDPTPVQLERLYPLRPPTVDANARYRGHPDLASTVWKYYQLIATQWTTSEDPNVSPNPSDDVSNVTLEPYDRGLTCVGCHIGTGADSSWLLNLRAQPKDPKGPDVEKLRNLLQRARSGQAR